MVVPPFKVAKRTEFAWKVMIKHITVSEAIVLDTSWKRSSQFLLCENFIYLFTVYSIVLLRLQNPIRLLNTLNTNVMRTDGFFYGLNCRIVAVFKSTKGFKKNLLLQCR